MIWTWRGSTGCSCSPITCRAREELNTHCNSRGANLTRRVCHARPLEYGPIWTLSLLVQQVSLPLVYRVLYRVRQGSDKAAWEKV